MRCEIVEVAHVEDATGYPCDNETSKRCFDCGSHLCDEHAENCDICEEVFCSICLAFHSKGHQKKPALGVAERQRQKSA